MMNQNFNPYGNFQQNAGYAPIKTPKYTQPLSQQRIAELRNKGGSPFSLATTQEEIDRAICTHRDPSNMQDTLIDNRNDGTLTCTICGATFTPADFPKEEIEAHVRGTIDILQSIKWLYLDIPENVAAEFFQMIPFIEKIPQLYQLAVDNSQLYGVGNQIQTMGRGNSFQMLNQLTNPMQAMGNPMMMQPQMYQQPGYAPQPMYQQPQMQPAGNPFFQQQQQAYQQQPQQQMQQPQQQPVQSQSADSTTVKTDFKL